MPADIIPASPATPALLPQQGAARHPVAVYLASLAPSSRRPMLQALHTAADILTTGHADAYSLQWQELRYQHTQALRAALAERYAPATANRVLSAVRRVLLECRRLGLLSSEDYAAAADCGRVKGERLPAGRQVEAGERAALLAVCSQDASPAGARDAALIGVLYSAGIRRAEAAALDLADYDATTGAVTVRAGKGNKERLTYVAVGARDALADWLSIRGPRPGPLFCPLTKSGGVLYRPLTGQGVYSILARRAQQAGIKTLTPHDLRRTFVGDLLDAGADLATVQKLAGHASPMTSARYDRRDEAAKRAAVGRLHVPYSRRK